jgi:hypothetical protein
VSGQGYDANCNFDGGSCCYSNPPNTTANCQWMVAASNCSSTRRDVFGRTRTLFQSSIATRLEKLDPSNCNRKSGQVSSEDISRLCRKDERPWADRQTDRQTGRQTNTDTDSYF